jgi:hypothetical protein
MEYTISFSFLTSLVEERIVLFKPKNKNYVRN